MIALNDKEFNGMVVDHAKRYFEAIYGRNWVYRAPETFENVVEQWIWALANRSDELAEETISKIENFFK